MKISYLVLLCSSVIFSFSSCGKKDSNPPAASSQPKDTAAAYTAIASSIAKLDLAGYESGTSLTGDSWTKLADETWTSADWATTTRFNCFGECSNGSITAKQYVSDALNKDKPGPMGVVNGGLDYFCFIGQMLPADKLDANGLPKTGSHTITITETLITNLKTNCGMEDETATNIGSATITIASEASPNSTFDAKVTFAVEMGGDSQSFPIYLKNSGGIVAASEFTTEGTAASGSVTRSIMIQDINTGEFRMEYYNRSFPVPTSGSVSNGGSYSFYRGYYNSTTKEVRFFSNMGSSYNAVNNTFLSVNGNESEAAAGAYVSRQSGDNTSLTGAFVCFTKADGTFVNATGCTENSAQTRVSAWNYESAMWKLVDAKGFADWGVLPKLPSFTADTMYTVEPDYK